MESNTGPGACGGRRHRDFTAHDLELELDHLCRALRKRGFSQSDAEDLAQEVMLVMCRRWQDYDRSRPLRLWLTGIAFRVASEHRRRGLREVPVGGLERQSAALDVESRLVARGLLSEVGRALARLPECQRAMLTWHDLENLSIRQIAARLGLSRPATYARLYAARRALLRASDAMSASASGEREALPPAAQA
jgi:RNA polymerase sigma-70 factor, ECF subfamily